MMIQVESTTPSAGVISFVWAPGNVLPAGTGGSENYTIGQVRELNRRGLSAQVVTVGLGDADGRDQFTDVPFLSVAKLADVSRLAGSVVFVNDIVPIETINPAFQMLHLPPPIRSKDRARTLDRTRGRVLIATSRYSAKLWAQYLDVDLASIQVVYPFAEAPFATQPRAAAPAGVTRILYAGRLTPEKGIYTLLAMLHNDLIADDPNLRFTATTAGADKPQGQIIEQLLRAHPAITLAQARTTPAAMAQLMSESDIVVMPSNGQYWHETFGIVSIEAQHTGCRVVASDDGGLPETDCGAVTFVEPDNAEALAGGIRAAIANGPLTAAERSTVADRFTVAQSVDALVDVLSRFGHPQRSFERIGYAQGSSNGALVRRHDRNPRLIEAAPHEVFAAVDHARSRLRPTREPMPTARTRRPRPHHSPAPASQPVHASARDAEVDTDLITSNPGRE